MSVKTEEINSAHVKRGPPPKKNQGHLCLTFCFYDKRNSQAYEAGQAAGLGLSSCVSLYFVLLVDLPQREGWERARRR